MIATSHNFRASFKHSRDIEGSLKRLPWNLFPCMEIFCHLWKNNSMHGKSRWRVAINISFQLRPVTESLEVTLKSSYDFKIYIFQPGDEWYLHYEVFPVPQGQPMFVHKALGSQLNLGDFFENVLLRGCLLLFSTFDLPCQT